MKINKIRNCKLCNVEFSLIGKNSQQRKYCSKECFKKYQYTIAAKKYRDSGKNRIVKKRQWLKWQYGITVEQHEELLLKAKYKCEICGKQASDFSKMETKTKSLVVDHCHKTGKIRGLLCFSCNVCLGYMKDDIILLKKAIIYLEKNNENTK